MFPNTFYLGITTTNALSMGSEGSHQVRGGEETVLVSIHDTEGLLELLDSRVGERFEDVSFLRHLGFCWWCKWSVIYLEEKDIVFHIIIMVKLSKNGLECLWLSAVRKLLSIHLQVSQNELQSPKSESSVAPAALGVELSSECSESNLQTFCPSPPAPPWLPSHNTLSSVAARVPVQCPLSLCLCAEPGWLMS